MILRPNSDRTQIIGIDTVPWLRMRSAYEEHLARARKYLRRRAAPRCYLSHLPEQAAWAEKLIHDLDHAGVSVIKQAADVVELSDFVIVLDTDAYEQAFQDHDAALAADSPLILERFVKTKETVIALRVEGEAKPHRFEKCNRGKFCDETHYLVGLFSLVLNLYRIPLTHGDFVPLRQALHQQWEQTLAGKIAPDVNTPFKVFISYSQKDEELKDELVTMLAGLQRRGVVDAWQDRCIEPGEAWHKAIHDALDSCDLALLLVSPNYLASRFIQEEEQPKLLQPAQEISGRVIPIIVRQCLWQSEPVLKDIQSLPKSGKPVITFSKENGDRDQVWTEIATAVEKRAKENSR